MDGGLGLLGAIRKKIFVWRTGFWGGGGEGWDYDVMLVLMNLVIIATNDGRLVLTRWGMFG